MNGPAINAIIEVVLMNSPPPSCRKWGMKAWVTRERPEQIRGDRRTNWSSVNSSIGPTSMVPALLKTTRKKPFSRTRKGLGVSLNGLVPVTRAGL